MANWVITRIGQERIIRVMDDLVSRARLHPAGARAIVLARNWQGALIVLRYLNLDQGGLS